MRIIGGEFKGKTFNPPKNFKARPTTDFAKESLFNILTNRYDFEELKILDLFSGTGSITYEFLSRGSEDITLVELDFNHLQFIKMVLNELKVKTVKAYRADAFKYLASCKDQYDLIFADPPYEHPNLTQLPELILGRNLLKPGGIVILEHPKAIYFNDSPNLFETRNYGHVHFSFFKEIDSPSL